ncbi:regulatory signaling modulator protein AmpE [Luteimonas sp. SDU82]|uniref:regulatory signaling modulator protein AmpE n=1 Tax=Luteimonas sp. SDU82 TaxID=3422592 RepID=UPI003EBB6E1D
MFATLLAVVVALALGHLLQDAAARRQDWLRTWLQWLEHRLGGARPWRGPFGIVLALLPLLVVTGLLQLLLAGHGFGLPSLLLGIAVLFLAWGPRNLDRDVEAVLDAPTGDARRDAAAWLWPPLHRAQVRTDAHALVGAVFASGLRRWFAVLLWFLVLGPAGALGYRLVAIAAEDDIAARLPPRMVEGAQALLAILDWPVAQLMTLSLALVGNFEDVAYAWKQAGGASWRLDGDFLAAAGRASVRGGVADEAEDYAGAGVASGSALVRELGPMPELREAMGLVWRALVLWLALLALFVIAGWVS